MKVKKEVLPIEKDKKLANEIKLDQKEFEKLFEKCVNFNAKKYDKKDSK
jgi:hypothetical protein